MLNRLFNPSPTIYKWDRLWVGFAPGLFLPLLAIPFFYFAHFSEYTFQYYLLHIKNPSVLSPVLSFGALFNLLVFFLFIWRDYYNVARGIVFATILYIIPILVTKYLAHSL